MIHYCIFEGKAIRGIKCSNKSDKNLLALPSFFCFSEFRPANDCNGMLSVNSGFGGGDDARAGEPGVRRGAPPSRRTQTDVPCRRGGRPRQQGLGRREVCCAKKLFKFRHKFYRSSKFLLLTYVLSLDCAFKPWLGIWISPIFPSFTPNRRSSSDTFVPILDSTTRFGGGGGGSGSAVYSSAPHVVLKGLVMWINNTSVIMI